MCQCVLYRVRRGDGPDLLSFQTGSMGQSNIRSRGQTYVCAYSWICHVAEIENVVVVGVVVVAAAIVVVSGGSRKSI